MTSVARYVCRKCVSVRLFTVKTLLNPWCFTRKIKKSFNSFWLEKIHRDVKTKGKYLNVVRPVFNKTEVYVIFNLPNDFI